VDAPNFSLIVISLILSASLRLCASPAFKAGKEAGRPACGTTNRRFTQWVNGSGTASGTDRFGIALEWPRRRKREPTIWVLAQ